MINFYLALLIILSSLQNVAAQLRTNFFVKRFELCNGTQGDIKYYGNVSTEGSVQYITYNITLPLPMDKNVGIGCLLEYSAIENEPFVELFRLHESNLCRAANIYLGEFWYDIERASKLPPRVCPIPAGRYHVQHLELNFRKISLQTFPFGRLRFTFNVLSNGNSKSLMCFLSEIKNTPY